MEPGAVMIIKATVEVPLTCMACGGPICGPGRFMIATYVKTENIDGLDTNIFEVVPQVVCGSCGAHVCAMTTPTVQGTGYTLPIPSEGLSGYSDKSGNYNWTTRKPWMDGFWWARHTGTGEAWLITKIGDQYFVEGDRESPVDVNEFSHFSYARNDRW